jgi:acetyl esterase/lipase
MARFDHPVVETDFRLPFYRRLISPRLAYHFDLATMGQNPYINPAHAPPSAHTGFPPCFVQYGDCEIFSDDVRALVDGLRRDGVTVEADEVYGGLHSDAAIKRVLGYKKGSWRSLMQAVQHMGWTSELP